LISPPTAEFAKDLFYHGTLSHKDIFFLNVMSHIYQIMFLILQKFLNFYQVFANS